MASQRELVFLKLGGSLITDKATPYTLRPRVLERLAREVCAALEARPQLKLLLGHGSGSFGHQAAAEYGTQRGVRGAGAWRGFAEVAAAAARLNRHVTDTFLGAGVPVWSLQPSASAVCHDGKLIQLSLRSIRESLDRGLVPLVYGDVALDDVRGGTIASTEGLFVYLAGVLEPARILLAGSAAGVLDAGEEVIPRITPAGFPGLRSLEGARETDVTGGMADKVQRMVQLVEARPDLRVHIFSGLEPGLVEQALVDPSLPAGTCILT